MGTITLEKMDNYSPRNGDEEKRVIKEVKRRLKMIYNRLDEAENILNTLPNTVNDVLSQYHNDDTSIPHILRWGAQNVEEVLENYKKVSRKFWGEDEEEEEEDSENDDN